PLGLLKLLASVTNVNILSTPQIMAMDNEDASIEVSSNIPVGNTITTTAGGAAQNSPDRRDATISLKIKPHISPGSETMRLEIEQKVEAIQSQSAVADLGLSNLPTILKRLTKTNVRVNNKDTIVLGGLMSDKEEVKQTKVPLLGDIPILGWLFKSKTSTL